MKTLGEALDRARSAAEELCTRLGAGITTPSGPPFEPDPPAQTHWTPPATPGTRR
jgi:hypothetical protein